MIHFLVAFTFFIATSTIGCHIYQPEGPFVPTDFFDPGHAVIDSDGNGTTVNGCGFTDRDFTGFDRNHIVLGQKPKGTIVSSTRFLGGMESTNEGQGKVVTSANIE